MSYVCQINSSIKKAIVPPSVCEGYGNFYHYFQIHHNFKTTLYDDNFGQTGQPVMALQFITY